MRGRSAGAWLYAAPALLINVVIILGPALLTVVLAFERWDGIGTPSWAGVANFESMFGDAVFWSALLNNLIWTGIFLTVPVGIGLLVAALMLGISRGRTALQVVLFLPVILATAITGRIWQGMIFSPETGVVAWLARHGIDLPDPLASPATSLLGVAVVDVWHWWGFLAVIFFAAMRQVSVEQIEAARIDGAGFWMALRWVVLPAIAETIVLMLIMTVIWSFLVFDLIFVLTKGGPAYGSEVLSTLAYRHAFFEFDVGQAAAASLVMSVFGLVATAVYLRIMHRRGAL